MARAKRSAAVMTIAIINLVIGFPCLCCGGITSGSGLINAVSKPDPNQIKIDDKAAANNPFMQGMKQGLEQEVFIQKELPNKHLVQGLTYGIGTVGALLLLTSGILLLLQMGVGRWVCIVGAALVLIGTLAEAVHTGLFVYPTAQKFAEKQKQEGKTPPAGSMTGGTIGQLMAPCGGVLIGGGYSVFAIIVMLMTPAAAFGKAARRPEDQEFDDRRDDYDRPADVDYDR